MESSNRESGQILLIVVLVATVLLTIGLSISQISVTEQRITQLEGESKRAFAAAEAGLDAAIRQAPGTSFQLSQLGFSGATGIAVVETISPQTFMTSSVLKDEEYTFYMADYDPIGNPQVPFSNYFSGNVTFYLGSTPSCPALELTLISNTGNPTRRLIDPCTQIAADILTTTSGGPFEITGTSFTYKTLSGVPISNTKLIIARSLFADTRIAITGSVNLPSQGKTITSTANTQTGVTQKIELFQSHPQIPASFYVTSF